MKKTFSLLLTSVLFICCCGRGQLTRQAEESAWPKIEADSVMPILAWHGIPDSETSLERFRELAETGITHHFSGYDNLENMQRALDIAEQTGIKMIISCPELKSDPEGTVKLFMNHPATAGYFLRDEPSTADFAELGEWAKRIRAVDDEHFCYLNLFPNYAPDDVLKADGYRDYVSRFDKEVPLQLLSFDHYPVVGKTLRPEFYENLEIFSDEARKAGKPFWAFSLATAHHPYPIPDLAQIRLQLYSDLAYGAQGLQYFTYWNPRENPVWDFHHAPITLDGKRTDVYDKIKEMNAELKALTGVFLGSQVQWVKHTGDTIPQGTSRLENLPPVVKKLETTGTGAVVSELRNGDKTFLVIVNRDFLDRLQVNIELDDTVSRILKDGSIVPASLYSDTMVVEPGDVLIYMY